MSPSADRASHGDTSPDTDSSIRTGLREVRARPAVAALIWIHGLAMLVFGAFPVLFIVFVTDYLNGGGTEVGVIRASSAFGGLLAAAVIGGLAKKHHPANVMAGRYLAFGVVAFAFVNAPPSAMGLPRSLRTDRFPQRRVTGRNNINRTAALPPRGPRPTRRPHGCRFRPRNGCRLHRCRTATRVLHCMHALQRPSRHPSDLRPHHSHVCDPTTTAQSKSTQST